MKRALIVDDHQENLYFLEVLLKANGFDTVDIAENGAKALELARANQPELIVSDILMPVMDGYALCRELKTDPHLKAVPFIFYTATFTTTRDEALALSLGADRFLIKPQEPENLMQAINDLLESPKAIHAENQPAAVGVEVMKEYSEALFRKLEEKMADLEQANRELRQREAELLAAREAAECAERAKMRFLNIMSHELRTPLNVILGTLQLSEYEKSYDPEMVADAKKALFSMLEMIDNILEAARVETSMECFSQKLFEPGRLLDNLKRLFTPAAHQKGLALRFIVHKDLPSRLIADVFHLQQVMGHLVNNAIKFTESGSVQVSLLLEQPESNGNTLLRIEIKDTGIGIIPDKQDIIFGLFTQADDSNTRRYEGTGLGLGLTKRLVELMGGTIVLNSCPGEGSTFTILLPFLPSSS